MRLTLTGKIFARTLIAGVGVLTFDGQGSGSYEATQVTEDMGVQRVSTTGTYAVNPDCTGSSLFGESATFDFIIVDGGKEIRQIATRPDRLVLWNIKKQDLTDCTNATLEGRHGLTLTGTIFARGVVGAVGVLTFDGEGNQSYAATAVFEDTGLSHVNLAGTYTVNPDCTGSSELGEGTTFDFVIVDGGKEILQIATRVDRVVTWSIKKQDP